MVDKDLSVDGVGVGFSGPCGGFRCATCDVLSKLAHGHGFCAAVAIALMRLEDAEGMVPCLRVLDAVLDEAK